jgi:hypothetical protein
VLRTFFVRSPDWTLLICRERPKPEVLKRCVFKHRKADIYMVADAYRGDEICQAILDFFDAASGGSFEPITVSVACKIRILYHPVANSLRAPRSPHFWY